MEFNFFDDAITAHLNWKRRLRERLAGRPWSLTTAEASEDRRCDLGQWLFGEGGRFANLAAHRRLVVAHARFHEEAAKILLSIEAGKLEEADNMLVADGPFSDSSAEVVAAIGQLRVDIDRLIQGLDPAA